MTQGAPPEQDAHFEREIINLAGEQVGSITLSFRPLQAYVVWESITFWVQLNTHKAQVDNGTAPVLLRFSGHPAPSMPTLTLTNQEYFYDTIVYRQSGSLICLSEGYLEATLGINSTRGIELERTYGTKENTTEFTFTEILRIREYEYLEERANRHLTISLAFIVLGLSIISTIEAVDRVFGTIVSRLSPKD